MKLICRNLPLQRHLKISSWRRIALGSWATARDPSIYGMIDVDAGPALDHLARISARTGAPLTITHFVTKAVAQVLRAHPEINAVLRLGRIQPRATVDAFVMVASDPRGSDLSGWAVRDADRKSVVEIARELESRGGAMKAGRDRTYFGMKRFYRHFPGILSVFLMRFLEWFLVTLNLWSPVLGFPRNAFGSVMISSLGSLGLDSGFGALVPFSGVPLFVTIGAIREVPAFDAEGRLVRRRSLRIGATIDHRVIDGVQASLMARMLREIFADPARLDLETGSGTQAGAA